MFTRHNDNVSCKYRRQLCDIRSRINPIFSILIFSIALFLYVAYIYYDHSNQNNWWRKDFGLKKKEDISRVLPSALLLGGSNVAYSLSASQLSESTKFSWFNIGLSSEAFNDENYWNFVSSTLNDKQRSDVELVVYSGMAFSRSGYLSSRDNDNRDTWGNRKLSYVPNTSLASRLKA